MGLDLILLPFDADVNRLTFSHTLLSCCRRGNLFVELLKVPTTPVTEDFTAYVATGEDGESCYGQITTTPYGDPLRYVLVKDLLSFKEHGDVMDNFKNRAIWSYLENLPILALTEYKGRPCRVVTSATGHLPSRMYWVTDPLCSLKC